MLYADKTDPNYENFSAECPYCQHWNIFNRRDDLRTFKPISFHEVKCQSLFCQKPFNINGDIINPSHELLLLECKFFIANKRYMQCVLNSAQAIESFLSLIFAIEILYRPFHKNQNHDLEEFNRISALLYNKVKKNTFSGMCNHLFYFLIQPPCLQSMNDSERYISQMQNRPNKPQKQLLNNITDCKVKEIANNLYDSKLNELRNQVVHKRAYRPSKEEAEMFLKEAEDHIYKFSDYFKIIGDDINWYCNENF